MDEEKRNEILTLLRAMLESVKKKPQEGTNDLEAPTLTAYLEKYIMLYSTGEEGNISQKTFVECHDPKEEGTDLKSSVRRYMHDTVKPFVKDFFASSEAKKYKFKLEFPSKGGYKLQLVPATNWEKTVSYVENFIFEIRYIPIFFMALPILSIAAVLIFIVASGIFIKSTVLFAFLLACMATILYVSWNLYRLSVLDFYYLFNLFNKQFFLFLKRSEDKIILATYSATCLECAGEVTLTRRYKSDVGYIAVCNENKHSHLFTFDFKTLKGKKLQE